MLKFCFRIKYFIFVNCSLAVLFVSLFFAKFVIADTCKNIGAKSCSAISCSAINCEKKKLVNSVNKVSFIEINIPQDTENKVALEDKIKDVLSGDVLVQDLTYNFDLNFKEKEFLYLVGFGKGDKISYKELTRAVSALIKKNKFEKILISISPNNKSNNSASNNINNNCKIAGPKNKCASVNINFALTGCWTFSKVKVSGIWVGKTEYGRYYTMEPGDVFNLESHNHAISKLKNLLKSQGYFNSDVTSSVNYEKETKSVSVNISLNRGSRFSIGQLDFFLSSVRDKKIDKIEKLTDKINELFKDKIVRNQYSKTMIERETGELKKYLAKKGFLHVDIELIERINYEENIVDLKLVITLHPKKEFIFVGNNFFSSAKLLEKILIYGRSAWLVPGSILSSEIIKEYQDKGFWDVKIDVKEDSTGCRFFIKEGERAIVRAVELSGVSSVDAKSLEKTCFAQLLNSKFFDQEILDKVFDDLINFYLASGFWDIKITKHNFEKQQLGQPDKSWQEVEPDLEVNIGKSFINKIFGKYKPQDSRNCYKLLVSLDEGQKSFLKSIAIKRSCNNSENIISQDTFDDRFGQILRSDVFKKIDPKCSVSSNSLLFESNKIAFNVGILSEQKNWLLKYFKDKGYLYVEVNLNLERDGQNVSIVWEINPGELVTFGKTIILSAKATQTDYIMRELQYKEGDIWDNNKLKASVSRLRSLGIFDSVHLYPYKASEKEGQKDILLKLNPTDPYEIRTRIGVERYGISKSSILGQGFTYKLGGAFLFKNPFEKADQLMVDFDVALTYRNASLSYIVPWVFDHQVKTTFKVYANRYEQPGFMCSKTNLYQAKQDGLLVGFNKIYNKVDFSLNTGLEWLETSVKTGSEDLARKVARAINFDSCLLGKKIPYLWLEPVFLLNTVDDKVNPRSGYFTLVSLKGMLPTESKYINSFFVKFMAEQSFFKAISPKIVGALRFRCGHIFHKDFKDITPIERFYLGGAHSIRSYEKDMCPPWGIFCDNTRSFADSSRMSDVKVVVGNNQDLPEASGSPASSSSGQTSVSDIGLAKSGQNLTSVGGDSPVSSGSGQTSASDAKSSVCKKPGSAGNTESSACQNVNSEGALKSGNCQNSWVIAPQGGRSTVSVNLEARFDIYKSMAGVIFQDMGTLFDDKFNSSNLSQATGFGVRFNTAVGPIRFDIGWKWKVRNEFESRCAWFLAFGNAF